MSEEMEALARRAVACPGWQQMRGMRGFLRTMVLRLVAYPGPGLTLGYVDDGEPRGRDVGPDWLPDFADRATLGRLEEVVAKAWNAEIMVLKEVIRSGPHAGKISHRVAVFRPEKSVDWGWTERYLFESAPERAFRPISQAEALIIALEAAPALEATP